MIALLTALAGTSHGPRNGLRDWVVNGAASCGHVTSHKGHFFGDSYKPVQGDKPSIQGIGGNAEQVLVHGYGAIRLRKPDGSTIELKSVAYVPDASANLFSVNAALIQLEKAGDKDAEFKEKTRSGKLVSGNGTVIVTCSKRGGLKYLDLHADQDF